MEKIDIKICLKKNKQRLKKYQKKIVKKIFFSLHGIKMEQKASIFGKHCINKNAFHKNKKPISISKVDNRRIVLSEKIYIVKKVHLNISLDA